MSGTTQIAATATSIGSQSVVEPASSELPYRDMTNGSYAYATGAPTAAYLSMLGADATVNVKAALLAQGDVVIGAAIMGVNSGSSSVVNGTAEVTFTPVTQSGGNLVLGLIDLESAGLDPAGQGIQITVSGGNVAPVQETFTTFTAASDYFDDHVVELGNITGAAQPITISFDSGFLDGSNFAAELIVGTSEQYAPLAQPELSATDFDFGPFRLGSVTQQAVGITNAGPAGADGLDVSLGGTTGNAVASGAVMPLAAGQSSSTLMIGLSTPEAGLLTGTVVMDLSSDGSGLDSVGPVALNPQVITLEGTAYAEAQPTLTSGLAIWCCMSETRVSPSQHSEMRGDTPKIFWPMSLPRAGRFQFRPALWQRSAPANPQSCQSVFPRSTLELCPERSR